MSVSTNVRPVRLDSLSKGDVFEIAVEANRWSQTLSDARLQGDTFKVAGIFGGCYSVVAVKQGTWGFTGSWIHVPRARTFDLFADVLVIPISVTPAPKNSAATPRVCTLIDTLNNADYCSVVVFLVAKKIELVKQDVDTLQIEAMLTDADREEIAELNLERGVLFFD